MSAMFICLDGKAQSLKQTDFLEILKRRRCALIKLRLLMSIFLMSLLELHLNYEQTKTKISVRQNVEDTMYNCWQG